MVWLANLVFGKLFYKKGSKYNSYYNFINKKVMTLTSVSWYSWLPEYIEAAGIQYITLHRIQWGLPYL